MHNKKFTYNTQKYYIFNKNYNNFVITENMKLFQFF